MASASDVFVSQLQAQPWFASVEAQFKGKGIADPLWESTLEVEDASLNPAIIVQDHYQDNSPAGPRVGLFQIDPAGMGSSIGTAGLQDPVQNATIAAANMARGIASDGTQYAPLYDQLKSIEKAGWPGNLSEDTQRQAALTAITGQAPNTAGIGSIGTSIAGGATDAASKAASAAVNALGLPNSTQISGWITAALIGSVLLALVAGGFTLLAAPAIEKAAPLAAAAA